MEAKRQKKKKKISAAFFLIFGHQNLGSGSGFNEFRIHNTAGKCTKSRNCMEIYFTVTGANFVQFQFLFPAEHNREGLII
jgi:hypothetical protein